MEGVLSGCCPKLLKTLMVLFLLVVAGEGHGHHHSELDKCLGECYPKCKVSQPLFCATLCLGKCKNSKSIPDNLCNCTYTCSKFKCADVGYDLEKVKKCVKSCSKVCNLAA